VVLWLRAVWHAATGRATAHAHDAEAKVFPELELARAAHKAVALAQQEKSTWTRADVSPGDLITCTATTARSRRGSLAGRWRTGTCCGSRPRPAPELARYDQIQAERDGVRAPGPPSRPAG
jgi:hypothetical protein